MEDSLSSVTISGGQGGRQYRSGSGTGILFSSNEELGDDRRLSAGTESSSLLDILANVEQGTQVLGANTDLMLSQLEDIMGKIGDLTLTNLLSYGEGVKVLGTQVDESICSIISLISYCEQLDHKMKPLENMLLQIKGIHKVLDNLEAELAVKDK
eukprot:Nk52_evm15s370 gene=Nk52_evmTU15s370